MIYINYPYRSIDYYPDSTRIYRPLTLYYNYYYPLRSLNYYSDVWPYYPYYRYLYYKYTLPSDRYYHLKGVSTKGPLLKINELIYMFYEYQLTFVLIIIVLETYIIISQFYSILVNLLVLLELYLSLHNDSNVKRFQRTGEYIQIQKYVNYI